MATEFHFFSFLPWELRDQIWKLAIRPDLPGAHVFRVRSTKASEQDDANHKTSDDDDSNCGAKSLLAAPQCLPQGVDFTPAAQAAAPISWTLNNPSTYLLDSGLWTACKESLLVIEKEFQERGRFTLPETATLAACSRGSGRRYVTVFPNQDLVVLQPADFRALDWDVVWDSFPNNGFPPGLEVWQHRDWDHPERHMALEYDPMWDKPVSLFKYNPYCHGGTALAGSPFTLGFIDYRIKRNPRCQATELEDEPQKVFYASDRRYIEVEIDQAAGWLDHDLMWDAGHQGPAVDSLDYDLVCGSSRFVERLREKMNGCWDYGENN